MPKPRAADVEMMALALQEARAAQAEGEVPVGAVLARGGQVLARGRNRTEAAGDARRHAETECLDEAVSAGCTGPDGFADCTLYVTLEPCAMCAGALVLSRVPRVVFGAWDEKAGMSGSIHDLLRHQKLNHRAEVVAGILEEECGALLKEFFAGRR